MDNPPPSPAASPAVVVLAAGKGARMRSALPKPLHAVGGAPMLAHVLRAARAVGPARLVVVTAGADDAVAQAARALDPDVLIAPQAGQAGTGDAARAALPALAGFDGPVAVVFADAPLIRAETLSRLIAAAGDGVAVAGFEPPEPGRYGRVALDARGEPAAIVEAADADAATLALRLCNAGPMVFPAAEGRRWLAALGADNAQGEYYLTDIVAMAAAEGRRRRVAVCEADEALGVNDRAQLAAAEAAFQARARAAAMAAGATLIAPETAYLAHDTLLGRDVTVEPHVVFGPGVTVADGVTIAAFSRLEGCVVEAGAQIGPHARLRPGAVIGAGARVGNFVEIKAATLGPGAKVNHLAYVGDATVGAGANLGAGTITCNYDGFAKHHTEIGAGAFIGSNSALVAPLRIGAGAYVASGSVVTADVAPDALAIGRARQVNRPGLAARLRERLSAMAGRK